MPDGINTMGKHTRDGESSGRRGYFNFSSGPGQASWEG